MIQKLFPHYCSVPSAWFHEDLLKKIGKKKNFKDFAQWGRAQAKSIVCNIFLPSHLWVKGELNYFVLCLVDKAEELLEDLRAEFESNPNFLHYFREQKNISKWKKGFFITNSGLICKSLGARPSIKGLRVKTHRTDLCAVDDLETKETIKNLRRQEEYADWIERDLIPTIDGNLRRFVMANNKFSPTMIQTILQEKHPNWLVHEINAYDSVTYKPNWPEKYSDTYFKELEDEIGVLATTAEFNNKPHIEGETFTVDQTQYSPLPRLNSFKIIIGRWYVAYAGTPKSDYNTIFVQGLHDKVFWVIDTFFFQCKIRAAVTYMAFYQKNLPKTVAAHWRYEGLFCNDEIERIIKEEDYNVKLRLTRIPTPRVKKYDRLLKSTTLLSKWAHLLQLKIHNSTQTGLAQLMGIEPYIESDGEGNKIRFGQPEAINERI